MIILLNDILPSKTSQRKFSSVLEPYAVKVASTVLRGECHCEVMFLPDKDLRNLFGLGKEENRIYEALIAKITLSMLPTIL